MAASESYPRSSVALAAIQSCGNTVVLYALSWLDWHDAAVIVRFIDDELPSGLYNDEALQSIWNSTPASIYFHEGSKLRSFLGLLRTALGRPPYSGN